MLSTKAGDVELAIPKLRKGSFFPSILEPRRRIDQALYAVVMEAYVHGVSTRAVDELVAALGVSSGISRSEVSRICAGLDEVVDSFRERRLDHVAFPYVYLDATYLHVREHHQVTSKAVVIATGVSATGHREILGIDVGDSENEVFWREFLRQLRARGLDGRAAGHLRPARRPGGGHQAVLPGGCPPALPGPLRPQPVGHDPQGPPAHGVGRLQDRLRPGVRRGHARPVGPGGHHPGGPVRQGRPPS